MKYKGLTHGPLDLCALRNRSATPLLGRQWLKEIKLDWLSIKAMPHVNKSVDQAEINSLKKQYRELFSDTMGKMTGVKAKVNVKSNARPVFLRARPVPLNIKQLVNMDIDRLVRNNIISPVKHSELATPIVPVEKK